MKKQFIVIGLGRFGASPLGKIIITITMFAGRLGPLTLAFALAQKTRSSKIGYPEAHV